MSEPIRQTDTDIHFPCDSAPVILAFPGKPRIKVHVRWMVRGDIREVVAIEQGCFEFPWKENDFTQCLQSGSPDSARKGREPWSEDDFTRRLRQRNCIGMVAEYEERVVGFMIYEIPKNRIRLLTIATAVEFRRSGVASQMITKLIGKLASQRRSRITLEVRETNLAAQLFFRELGFRATEVLKNHYEDVEEDAYRMQLRCSDIASPPALTRAAG